MEGFELLEHTADIGVLSTGDSFASALSWVAQGMFSVIADLDAVEPRRRIVVEVSSEDRESLVVDWLNELIFRFDTEGFLPAEFRVTVDESHTHIAAECAGETADPERHQIRTAVKAATYHRLEVRHDDQWRIQVILDV